MGVTMTSSDQAVDQTACENPSIDAMDSSAHVVGDVMVRRPKTLPVTATAAEARQLFTNPKVRTALVVDGISFAGLLDPDDVPATLADHTPIRDLIRSDVATITPERTMREAIARMTADGAIRLVVLDEDATTLRGLLCLDHERSGFCQG